MGRWLGLLLCLVAAGCHRRPPPGISVVRQGGDYLFRFAGCGPRAEPARIMDLELSTGDQRVCSLVLTHDPRMTIAGLWKYGEVPAAYKKKLCAPLTPAHRYHLEVTHATLDFELAPNGDVVAQATACR